MGAAADRGQADLGPAAQPGEPNVCSLTVTYDVGHNGPLLSLMNAWAGAKGLAARKVREPSEGPMRDRWTSSWEGPSMAVVFSEEKTRDGQPVGGDVDQATVLLSVSKTA